MQGILAAMDGGEWGEVMRRNAADLPAILPELILIATIICVALLLMAARAGRHGPGERPVAPLAAAVAISGLLTAGWAAAMQWGPATASPALDIFSGMLVLAPMAVFFKLLIVIATALAVLAALGSRELGAAPRGEFVLMILATGLGAVLLAGASNLLMLYLAIEAVSLTSYGMAGFLARHRRSSEAGMKYVVYGAFASGVMIFAISYLYGLSGSLEPAAIAEALRAVLAVGDPGTASAIYVLLLLLFAGLGYKIAAAPFHLWTPDVYEGSPTVATAFFSIAPKAAGFAALIRLVGGIWGFSPEELSGGAGEMLTSGKFWAARWEAVPIALGVIAIITMTVGNVIALRQTNAKRMLAYSSIAHAGYMLAGLAVLGGAGGPRAVLFYLIAYLVMNFGAFACVIALENRTGSAEMRDLAGAIRYAPALVISMIIFLFALVGLPPTIGFMAKLRILMELVGGAAAAPVLCWSLVAAVIVNTVVSLFYYLRLATRLASGAPHAEPAPALPRGDAVLVGVVVALAVLTLLLIIATGPLVEICRAAMP